MVMRQLRALADREEGWLQVVRSMIDVIPLDDPLGPATISVLLDECPLPAKETVVKLVQGMDLPKWTEVKAGMPEARHRNIAMVLGTLADKLAGPRCNDIFDQAILNYLVSNLVSSVTLLPFYALLHCQSAT